jgi:competence protein ComFC
MYIIQKFIDTFFPPTANEKLVQKWSDSEFRRLYQYQQTHQGIYYLSEYSNPLIKAAIQGTKFEQSIFCAKKLALLVKEFCNSSSKDALFLPIPLSARRERERGFNQVTRVLKYANDGVSRTCIYNGNILTRKKHTQPQTLLERKDRLTNMTDAFMVNNKYLTAILKNNSITTIILCDDVITTGATLQEASHTIRPHLPPHITIICLAWAH